MSTATAAAPAAQPFTLMPQAQAEDVFGTRVWSEAYFNKLAECGIVPASQEDVNELLKLAGNLRAAESHPAVKAAQSKSPFALANEAIEQFLGGEPGSNQKRAEAIAAQLLQDPQVYQAAFSLKAAEAQQYRAQQAQTAA